MKFFSMVINSLISIGDDVFFFCIGLKSIVIPNSVKSIGKTAFIFCEELTSITLGRSVENIGYHAFDSCEKLTSITIPSSLTSLGESVFKRCTYIKTIYNHIQIPIEFNNSFEGIIQQDGILYVPKGSKDAYSTAPGWCNFVNIQEMDDTMTGVNTNLINSNGGSSTYFTIDGKKTANPYRGLNIIKNSDGRFRKVLVK